MKDFVRLKHYAVFLLIFVTPFVLLTLSIGFIDILFSTSLHRFEPILFIILFCGGFLWLYSVGTNLHKKLPELINMNIRRFKIFVIAPFVYLFLLILALTLTPSSITSEGTPEAIFMLTIAVLHLFSIYCVLYSFYFIAKCLKIIQYQRLVSFSEYAGDFFLLWILPVGIWILQPKINKVFTEEKYELGSDIPVQQQTHML